MITINDEVAQAIARHAAAEYPRESCGLIVGNQGGMRYAPCRNDAQGNQAQDSFVVNPQDWVEAENDGEILAVVHSHPNASANPSDADRVMCQRTGLPWIIMGYPSQVIVQIDPPTGRIPLVGRTFHHGIVDCYTLVRDYYFERLGIYLPDFHREDEWWKPGADGAAGADMYQRLLPDIGFVRLGAPLDVAPQAHDLLLMEILSSQPNHAAVMDGQRPGLFLHHLYGRLSGHDVWGGAWSERTVGVFRHASLMTANATGGQ